MKFSHSLQFNCVPEWTDHYLNYPSLKRALYTLEQAFYEKAKAAPQPEVKDNRFKTLDREFKESISKEVEKVITFYRQKENSCDEDMKKLTEGAESDRSIELVKTLYLTLNDLVYFFELNREGFLKLLQKYQRYLNQCDSSSISEIIEEKLNLGHLQDPKSKIRRIEEGWGAKIDLNGLLRERVIFERSTVWQEMVEMERKTSNIELVQQSAVIAPTLTTVPDVEKSAPAKLPSGTPHDHLAGLSAFGKARKILMPIFCLIVFIILWFCSFFDEAHLNRALAMVVFTILLWCTEAIPLYATALLVPFLVVLCNVLHPGIIEGTPHFHTERPAEVAKFIFSKMFSETIMLLLGGFSLASALTKYGLAKMVSIAVIGRAGRNPGVVLLVVMAITTVASLIISNVAAPVLTFSLIQPLLRALSVDHPLAKSLVVGVAYAANIGGLTSPISSPQNLFAMKDLRDKELTWFQWCSASIPVAILTTFTTWIVLRICYRTSTPVPDVLRVKTGREPLNGKQIYVIAVTVASIGLWMTATKTKMYFGGIGILAIFPLLAFFGSGILGKEDFNGFLWNVVMLAMGGSAIGTVVQESGLLKEISNMISDQVTGLGLWTVCIIFSLLMLVVSTFVSHSVSSIIMTPVVVSVGKQLVDAGLPSNSPQVMVAVVTFICSIGMGMPISGFPNITAMSQEDGAGRSYIQAIDFFKTGIIASLLATAVILVVGFFIFKVVI